MNVSVRKETIACNKFQKFLRNDENKNELFIITADALSQVRCQKKIIATAQEEAMSNRLDRNFKDIMPCNREETDTRLIIPVFDAIKKGFEKASIITVNRVIVFIALYHYFDLQIDELRVEFGIGEHKRWLPIHEYAEILGEETCRGLYIHRL